MPKTVRSPLERAVRSTIAYKRQLGLITSEHALTVRLIEANIDTFQDTASPHGRAELTREIRALLESLPAEEVETQDTADEFLNSL